MSQIDYSGTDRQQAITRRVDGWLAWVSIAVINVLALFSVAALVWATFGVGLELYRIVTHLEFAAVNDLIVSILTVFILMEVLTVSVGFLRAERIAIVDLVDVTFAITFREIWVGLFSHQLNGAEIAALALLILALTVLRYMVRAKTIDFPGRNLVTPTTQEDTQ